MAESCTNWGFLGIPMIILAACAGYAIVKMAQQKWGGK